MATAGCGVTTFENQPYMKRIEDFTTDDALRILLDPDLERASTLPAVLPRAGDVYVYVFGNYAKSDITRIRTDGYNWFSCSGKVVRSRSTGIRIQKYYWTLMGANECGDHRFKRQEYRLILEAGQQADGFVVIMHYIGDDTVALRVPPTTTTPTADDHYNNSANCGSAEIMIISTTTTGTNGVGVAGCSSTSTSSSSTANGGGTVKGILAKARNIMATGSTTSASSCTNNEQRNRTNEQSDQQQHHHQNIGFEEEHHEGGGGRESGGAGGGGAEIAVYGDCSSNSQQGITQVSRVSTNATASISPVVRRPMINRMYLKRRSSSARGSSEWSSAGAGGARGGSAAAQSGAAVQNNNHQHPPPPKKTTKNSLLGQQVEVTLDALRGDELILARDEIYDFLRKWDKD